MVTHIVKARFNDVFFLILGIFGSVLLIYGLTQTNGISNHLYYAIGSFLLLTTAINAKIVYFIALETILWCGHLSILLQLNPLISIILPILLSLQFVTYAYLSGMLSNYFIFIGIIGITFITTGLVINNHYVFFSGSLSITVYALYLTHKGIKLSLLWAITNAVFALVALINILRGMIW